MKPSTLSLFEREMHDQVAAAQAEVDKARERGDQVLLDVVVSHLDHLRDLARRNGLAVEAETSA